MITTKRSRVTRNVISTAIGLLAALSVAVLLWVQVSRVEASGKELRDRLDADIVEVVVAKRDIAVGEQVTQGNTVVESWLSTLLPSGAVSADQADSFYGETVSDTVLAGEPVSVHRVGTSNSKRMFDLAEGLSAVSIKCDPVTALGGEVEPGALVDVMGSVAGGAVDCIVPRAQILSSSNARASQEKSDSLVQGFSGSEQEVSWVTLAVPSELVKQLVTVASQGTVYLVLPGAKVSGSRG